MNAKIHLIEICGKYPYLNDDFILNQLRGISLLGIAGFHAYDCCEKLFKRAYEQGIDSLVDEDLTQFFLLVFQY